jgi:glycine cleavage system aminomethyltransferase T
VAALNPAGHSGGLTPDGLTSRDTLRPEGATAVLRPRGQSVFTTFEVGLARIVAFEKLRRFVGGAAIFLSVARQLDRAWGRWR